MRHIRPTGRPLWWSGREVQLTPAVLLQTMWCPVQLGRMSESLSARPRIGQQSSCGPATSGFKVLATKRPARRVRRVKRDASSHIVVGSAEVRRWALFSISRRPTYPTDIEAARHRLANTVLMTNSRRQLWPLRENAPVAQCGSWALFSARRSRGRPWGRARHFRINRRHAFLDV